MFLVGLSRAHTGLEKRTSSPLLTAGLGRGGKAGGDGLGSGADLGELTCLDLPEKQGASLAARLTLGGKALWAR